MGSKALSDNADRRGCSGRANVDSNRLIELRLIVRDDRNAAIRVNGVGLRLKIGDEASREAGVE